MFRHIYQAFKSIVLCIVVRSIIYGLSDNPYLSSLSCKQRDFLEGGGMYLALNVCCFDSIFSLKLFSIQEELSEIP